MWKPCGSLFFGKKAIILMCCSYKELISIKEINAIALSFAFAQCVQPLNLTDFSDAIYKV